MKRHVGRRVWIAMGLAGLCCLAYARSITLPLISDDYLQIGLARRFGPLAGWSELADDALYRCRATSLLVTWWVERLFGVQAMAFHLCNLFLHILCTLVIFAFGAWRTLGWRAAAVTAAFFAVYEGHQEAVIWHAALPELLVFATSAGAVLCWLLWLQSSAAHWWYYAGSLVLFLLALLSKESAVIVPALLMATSLLYRKHWKLILTAAAPFLLLSFSYTLAAFAASRNHLHFHDGTFSLNAPVLLTLANSAGRLFWFWGLLAAIVVIAANRWRPVMPPSLIWILLGLLPYSFLTYMPRVPSRHTYLASAGLAFIVASAFLHLWDRARQPQRRLLYALAVMMVLHNCGYIWIRKQAQFAERAEPTEQLLRFARTSPRPVLVECFPYHESIAWYTLQVGAGLKPSEILLKPAPQGAQASRFCYRPQANHCP